MFDLKKICFFLFLMPFVVNGQYSRIQVGALGSGNYLSSKVLNEPVSIYNVSSNQGIGKMNQLNWGGSIGLYGLVHAYNGLQVQFDYTYNGYFAESEIPRVDEFNYGDTSLAVTRLTDYLITYQVSHSYGVSINHYFLKFLKGHDKDMKADQLYLQYIYRYSTGTYFVNHYFNCVSPAGSFQSFDFESHSFGLGIGYDMYIGDKVAVTPFATVMLTTPFGLPGYGEAVNLIHGGYGTDNPSVPSFSNSGELVQVQVGVKVGFVAKSYLPKCPVQGCGISLHHRHRETGETVFRGNKLQYAQNPRIGDRYKKNRRIIFPWMKDVMEFVRKYIPEKEPTGAEEDTVIFEGEELEGEEAYEDSEEPVQESTPEEVDNQGSD